MQTHTELFVTSVLFIDGNDTDRKSFAAQLKYRSSDYDIIEATNGKTAVLYRLLRIDCCSLNCQINQLEGIGGSRSDNSRRMWLS
jgi:hypothetical protein